MIQDKKILNIEVQTNGVAKAIENGKEQTFKSFKSFKSEYPSPSTRDGSVLAFYTKDSQYIREPFRVVPSATAKLKRNQIQSIKDEYALKTQQYNNHQTELQNLIAENTIDPVKREHNMKRIEELKREKTPDLDIIRIRELEFEAATAGSQDALQTEIRRLEHEKQEDDKQSKSVKTTLSGVIKWVVVED